MRSLSDYKTLYSTIASNLNLQGDSVELLVNLLANASYIEEVQNITYSRESTLETATLLNSKIIHCINLMYSVFRGHCPRVIMKFSPDRVQNFNVFDEIVSSNNFKIYYLGYYKKDDNEAKNLEGTDAIASEEDFVYAPLTINAIDLVNLRKNDNGDEEKKEKAYMIIGLLAKEYVDVNNVVTSTNTYYTNCLQSNLSNDMFIKVSGENGKLYPVTRHFSDHVEFGKIFDLTLPDFGSRLYIKDILKPSTSFTIRYFKYTTLSEYNESELKKIKLKGTRLIQINPSWLSSRGYTGGELTTGIVCIDSSNRDSVLSTHYNANKERYLNSIFRSNSDLGNLLKEAYPEKVRGTYYFYSSDPVMYTIYYIPQGSNRLTSEDINSFIEDKKGYYVTPNLDIREGVCYDAIVNLRLKLIDVSVSVKDEVESILSNFSRQFNINLEEKKSLIRSTIGKISNIREVSDISIDYYNAGEPLEDSPSETDLKRSYFNISTIITASEN